jgi:predicted ester cyclase
MVEVVGKVRVPSGANPDLERNKEVVRRMCREVWTEGRLDVLPEVTAADAVDHRAPPGSQGIEGARQHIVAMRAGISDLRLDIIELVAEGDLVSCELLWSGYHDGDLFGIPPTYRWARCRQSCTYRIANGKIAEVWQVVDMLGLLEDFGVAPPQGMSPIGIVFFTMGNIFRIGMRKARKAPPKPPAPDGWPYAGAAGR